MHKLLLFLVFLVVFFKVPVVFADNEFATDYLVNYEVLPTGVTQVSEDITLKNLTDKYYASDFSLTIGATKIQDVKAFDVQGSLESNLQKANNQSVITVKFNQQLVGKDKTYKFTLKFSSLDFAEKNGKVWQITIPRIQVSANSDNYNLSLFVPGNFGDPTSIVPEPIYHSEESGKIVYKFNKNQITTSGVLANFGTSQLYLFKFGYKLENTSLLPSLGQIPLPPDTSYQQVSIDKLEPKPDNVTIDGDGNNIAWYKINPKSSISVNIEGLTKMHFDPSSKAILDSDEIARLTSAKKYWEKDNPIIKRKLLDIFKDKNPKSVKEKAKLINDFVVNFLKYNENRVKSGDFDRLGSLTVLNNPENALCGEFTDLFITLARAGGIPARQLIGYASSTNQDLRPLSFSGIPLHAWPEYYDSDFGWVMIDPTWQNTSGGVDYFSKMDLNHFVLAIRGLSSLTPNPSNEVKVEFSDSEFNPISKAQIYIDVPNEVFAGLPGSATVTIQNTGSLTLNTDTVKISSSKLSISPLGVQTPLIPPFGHTSFKLNLKSGNIFDSYPDFIDVSFNKYQARKALVVKSFFTSSVFPILGFAILFFLFGVYFLVLRLHRTKFQKLQTSKK